MKLMNFPKVTCLLTAAVLAGGSLLAAAPAVKPSASKVQSEDWKFPAEASQLLKEIQSTANKLSRDAATLESYARGGLTWHRHADQLTFAKEHINEIGERLERLQAIRHIAAPWQQRAIDSIVPVAVSLVGHTEAAIQHLNESRSHLWAPVYVDRLKMIADRAGEMKESVDLHLELASTQDKLEALRSKVAAIGS